MYRYAISLAVVLSVIWLLFSGMWSHLVIVPLGIASVLLVVYITHRLKILDREANPLHLLWRSLAYWPWLLLQIFKSNIDVATRILSRDMRLSPCIVRLPVSQKTALGRTILANSISQTPGTVSIHVRDHEIWLYALTESMARDLFGGEMDRRVSLFEGAVEGRH